MKKKMTVLWIDDDPKREEDAKNIMSEMEHLDIKFILADRFIDEKSKKKYNFINLKNKPRNRPDLFFIDFRLDRKAEGKISRDGWSVASQIRACMPDIPIYGVSAFDYDDKSTYILEAYEKEYFDKLLTITKLEDFGSKVLYYDSFDYYKLRQPKKRDIEFIFNLLKTPESSKDYIKQVLPEIFMNGINDFKKGGNPQSNPISFARWVIRELLIFPGPLYNRLYTATHLGVTERGFKKIEKKFNKALYFGVFSRGFCESRWWVSEVDNLLFSNKKAKKFDDTSPWVLAPKVFNVDFKERTKCIVCKGDYPETVGLNKENARIQKPVHYSCSIPHPTIKRKLFYDEIRAYPIE